MKRPVRKPKRPSAGSARARVDTSASAPWEARLCELELRLTQLESENRKLRDACQQLETTSANYAKLYDLAPVGLVSLDSRGAIRNINRAGAAIVGRDPSRLRQRRLDFLVAPEDVPNFSDLLRACQRSRNLVSREISLRGAAGEPIFVHLAAAPVLDEKSRVTQFEITLVDLTQRRHAEAALRMTEQYLRTLIETSPHPVQLLDANARWLLANPAALELFDLTGVDYHHKRNSDLAIRAPFYRAVLAARDARNRTVLKTGQTTRNDERVPKPDGSERILDVIRVPLVQPGDPPKGLAVLSYDLTERKQAEEFIRAKEAQLRNISDITPVIIAQLGRDLRFQFVNRACAEFLRRTPGQIVGRPMAEILGQEAFETIQPHVKRVLQGHPVEYETEVPYQGIGRRFMHVSYRPDKNERGEVVGWVAAVSDITERKQVEQRHAFLAAIVQSSSDPIISKTLEGIITSWNPGAEAMFGYSPSEIIGQSILRLIPPERAQEEEEILARLRRGKRIEHYETIRVARNGRRIPVSLTISPVKDATGKIIGASKIIHDITERKRAEEALRESETRFRTLASNAPVGIFMSDTNGNAVYVNETWCAIAGLKPERAMGKGWLEAVHPEDRQRIASGWQEAVAGSDSSTTEFRFLRPVQAITWVLGNAVKLRNANGEHIGFVGTIADITARKQAEETLRVANDKLEARVQGRTQLLTQANEALLASEAKLQAIMDNSPAMIFVKDLQGRYLHFNRRFASEFQLSPSQALGKTDSELFPPGQAMRFRKNDLKVLKAGASLAFDEVAAHEDGPHSSIVTKYPLRDAEGKIYAIGGIVTDITERRRIEEALRESEKNLAEFFEQAPLGLLWVSPEGLIQRVNRAQLDLLGCTARHCLGRELSRFFSDPELAGEALGQLARGALLQNYRARIRRKDGSARHVLIDANGLWQGDQLLYSRWFIRNITHRVELEQEILAISERERQRLGRDLHDDLCQQLSGIEFLSHTLAGQLSERLAGEAARAREIAGMIRRAIECTRELAQGLSPMRLTADGLLLALQELADRTQKLFHITCSFRSDPPMLINDEAVGIHLYRIAQEAISNSIKHGKARSIDIVLAEQSADIMLAVRDNGVGFPVKLRKRRGMGLRVMQYRAGVLGGSLIVQRQVNGGTTVVCTVKTNSRKSPARRKEK